MFQSTPPSDLIRSVSRALRLLEAVGDHPTGVNAKRLASRCGLRLGTTYHLLRTLRYEGYLDRLPSGDYVLGPALAERFADLPVAVATPPSAGTVLRDLVDVTGHSAYLASFVEGRVTITDVVEGPGSPPLEDLVVGFDEAAHATALGKALLSTLTAPGRRRYLRETGLRPFTAATVRNGDDLLDELSAVRSGIFTECEQYRNGVACVAALVTRPDSSYPAAIGLSHRARNVVRRRAHLLPALRGAARDLAAA
ncbi:MAG TPA: IclR family transcriptional regulator C-terminal domain-containing protein [Euzebyales bacterium]